MTAARRVRDMDTRRIVSLTISHKDKGGVSQCRPTGRIAMLDRIAYSTSDEAAGIL